MPLIREDDLIRIDLPAEGEWVEVKKSMSRGDEIAVQRALTVGSRVTAGSKEIELSGPDVIEAAEFARMECAIKAWSFAEPVTAANIRALDPASVLAIRERLDELYPEPRTDDQKKVSGGNGTTPPSARGKHQPSSVG